MRRLLIGLLLAVIGAFGVIGTTLARASVRGYYRSSGTYVAPHYRSSPDSYRSNNYSSRGNYNPYTGKKGYVRW